MTGDPLVAALRPITSRVRTDKTAVKPAGSSLSFWTGGEKSGPVEALTDERMAKHLNGGPARGVCPLQEGGDTVELALLDFDSHRGETSWVTMSVVVSRVAAALELAWGMSPILFRSGGGMGAHLYLLWEGPQDAWTVRQWLGEVLAGCGLRDGTGGVRSGEVEVFPRQDRVPMGGSGNQFILPMAGKGAPLALDELSEMLSDLPREAVLAPSWWPVSPGVPRRERPVREVVAGGAPGASADDLVLLGQALEAIPNGRAGAEGTDLTYDDWLAVVHGVHWAYGGDEVGLEVVREWSACSGKHVAEVLEKCWRAADAGRVGGITLGSVLRIAGRWGWVRPDARPNADDFDVVPEAGAWSGGAGVGSGETLSAPVERRSVPPAKHLCTDQANAVRLVKAYGSRVLVAAGRWHAWDGRRWKADEGEVYRYACQLSRMVKDEAAEVVRRAKAATLGEDGAVGDGSSGRVEKAMAVAEALEKWGTKCEMKGTIEAAVGLARKMLTVDAGLLDRDPWLLNCRNGVVDLRDGSVRGHRSEDLMTRLVDVDYVAGAVCAEWEKALGEICGGDASVVAFLRRWFGYCLTGHVREQAFVVHWGDGSNGKSTVLDLMARTMGDYAGVAAPGLVASSDRGERHPTEVAALMGRRMVTAHETRDGVALREDFIKQATGDDVMTARFMREDFFDFKPTHKIQLLTNHKPVIKGQDRGIWRRVMLVPYGAVFGTAEEVAAGVAGQVKDMTLLERLRSEEALQGVLAWRVRGAVEWAAVGLKAPDAVLDASARYQGEQDRIRQWVGECCEVGAEWTEPLTLGMSGLYPSYVGWCRDAGYHALGRARFADELRRAFPSLHFSTGTGRNESGGRRKITQVAGIRTLMD